MTEAISQIMSHEPDAKPAQNSASLQGLGVAMAAPVVVPILASVFGMEATDAALLFQHIITGLGALWSLFGILRRADIRMPWQKAVGGAE